MHLSTHNVISLQFRFKQVNQKSVNVCHDHLAIHLAGGHYRITSIKKVHFQKTKSGLSVVYSSKNAENGLPSAVLTASGSMGLSQLS